MLERLTCILAEPVSTNFAAVKHFFLWSQFGRTALQTGLSFTLPSVVVSRAGRVRWAGKHSAVHTAQEQE